ncbi:L-2-amino-thiazoline-4-carboxylic acid hydrolase [Aminirod propionatiphilus]|uniref:L-2-amino-thiazoline-4-carboxylic acid hydrolase n=1 Tax=Aminirod propionatiphilus TaxID=3415223 RepID=A0ACD1DWF8_9BACT|nr:L-2-amino-thiazoline-4-carboxylic acid hydrolase [Synergistota bacterium]
MNATMVEETRRLYETRLRFLAACLEVEAERLLPRGEALNVTEKAWERFVALLPELPYIGGEDNPLTENLLGAAYEMGFYELLEERGLDVEAVAAVNRAALALYTRQKCPPEGRAAMREAFFRAPSGGPDGPRKAFDGDWAARRVEPGEGDGFDFGVDYSRCAIVDLYRSRGAQRFLPYLCANDYAVFEELGLCLERTETIGNGASRCDFRFRREGRPRHVERVDGLAEFSKRP